MEEFALSHEVEFTKILRGRVQEIIHHGQAAALSDLGEGCWETIEEAFRHLDFILFCKVCEANDFQDRQCRSLESRQKLQTATTDLEEARACRATLCDLRGLGPP